MNEPNEYNHIAAQTAALAAKLHETNELKKNLINLSVSVIAATIATESLAVFLFSFFPSFLDSIGISINSATADYFLMWLINDIAAYFPPIFIFGILFHRYKEYQKPGEPYEFKPVWVVPLFFASIALNNMANIFTNLVSELFELIFGGEGLTSVFESVMPQSNGELLIMFLMVGFVGPIFEEYIYRHLLLKPLRRFGDFQAVIITSLLFGFFHGNLTQFLYTTMAGFILGIAAIRANSVVPAMIIHIMNNVYVIFYAQVFELAESGSFPLDEGSATMFWFAGIGLGVASLIVFAIKGRLGVENTNPHLSSGERVRIITRMPTVIIMAVLLVLYTILGTVLS